MTADPEDDLAAALTIISEMFGYQIASLSREAQMSIATKLIADLTMQFAEEGQRAAFLRYLIDKALDLIEP